MTRREAIITVFFLKRDRATSNDWREKAREILLALGLSDQEIKEAYRQMMIVAGAHDEGCPALTWGGRCNC
jgi:hypothetical protein